MRMPWHPHIPASERGLWLALLVSLSIHLLVLFGRLPLFEWYEPRQALPRFEVKMVEIPAPPSASPVRTKPRKPALAAPSVLTTENRGEFAQKPQVEDVSPEPVPEAVDPPLLTEQELQQLDRRYLPESTVDQKVQAVLAAPSPDYPEDALRRGVTGCVLAAVLVGETGKVDKVEILRSDAAGVFDAAVISAHAKALYIPAFREGKAVKSRILGVASFTLADAVPLNCELKYYDLARQLNAAAAGGP
jgi:TonB family protein